ncbi:MAG: hypothetical protein IPL28_17140 [Chloroflexi bacterium]|nr:hypothetical protein [Chloroflexota bacterium]
MTRKEAIGQINGLAVLQLDDYRFGRPNRITARVRLGKGEVVDIERQVEMGGPIHSKGVMILAGYVGAQYAAERPLALSATLVFEQSYGGWRGTVLPRPNYTPSSPPWPSCPWRKALP